VLVGILVPFLNTFGKKGYYHSQELGLAKCLIRHGHKVIIYKCFKGKAKSYDENIEGIEVKYLNVKGIGTHTIVNPDILSNKIDVLFTFSDTQLFIPVFYKWCKKNNILFISYVGTIESVSKDQVLKKWIMDFVFKYNTLKIYRKNIVFAKTISVQNQLLKLGVKESFIVPVGMDLDLLKFGIKETERPVIRNELGFSNEEKIILFVGRLVPEKRPFNMIDIFEKVFKENQKFKLVMIGDGSMYHDVNEYIIKKKLNKVILQIRKVPYDQMWKYHYMADYFVNLWNGEIFGMAVMESVFYESCTIAIEAPGPQTILDELEAHSICKNDDEVVENLLNKINDPKKLEMARDKLISKFSWDKCVEQIEVQYTKCKIVQVASEEIL
jgi:glycosyltransferase involved in cell wall biosynthesis